MSYTDFDFPHTSLYTSDLREIIANMRRLEDIVKTFVNTEQVKFADPIIWNITSQYAKTTVVLNTAGNAYLSKQAVPSGIQLNNEEYWQEIFNFTEYTRTANQNLTVNEERNTTRATHNYAINDWLIWNDVLYKVTSTIAVDDTLVVGTNLVHFTVEDFLKAFITYATNLINQYKNDIDASELAYRQQLAQDIANTTTSLQTQLDQAISGATVDSEVINARVGFDNRTYTTLRNAIVGQVNDIYDEVLFIHENIDGLTPLTISSWVDNKYIRYDGAVINNSDFHYSAPIFLTGGQTILVKSRGSLNNVSILSKTDSSDSVHTRIIRSTVSDYLWYSAYIPSDGYYNFCCMKEFDIIILRQTTPPNTLTPLNMSIVYGKYINGDGNIGTATEYGYSEPVLLTKGTKLLFKVKGFTNNVAWISKTVADGSTHTPIIISPDSNIHSFIYTIPENGYYAFSSWTNPFYVFSILVDDYIAILYDCLNIEIPKYTVVNNKFINQEGTLATNNSFFYTQMYLEKGTRINIITDGYGPNVMIVSRCDENNTYRYGLLSGTKNGVQLYSYDVCENGYYLICGQKSYYKIFISPAQKIKNERQISLSLFERIGVIGDSFASGQLYYDGAYHTKYAISWPQQLARRNGIIATNYSEGGLSARTWLSSPRGLALLNSSPADNLYILGLGINDSNPDNPQPLGQLTDITDYNDPNDYLDTFYGNYGKIVEAIKAHAPHAKIIFMTFIAPDENREAWNDAIRVLSKYYQFALATLQYDDFYTSPVYTDMAGSHPTAIGYSLMSVAYDSLICDAISREYEKFINYYMY